MRKLILLTLALVSAAAGLLAPLQAKPPGGGSCVTHCTSPNPCGYICCYERCCGGNCVILDCAPPPPCGEEN